MQKHTLRIVTYNTLYDSHVETIWQNIQKVIEDGIDIFCLQEISPETYLYFKTHLEKFYGKSWHIEVAIPDDLFGCALLWHNRLKLKELDRILLPKYSRLKWNEAVFYLLDGIPLHSVRRTCISALFTYQDKLVQVAAIHLSDAGGKYFRMKQLAAAHEKVSAILSDISVICGDFNSFDFLKTGDEKLTAQSILKNYVDTTNNIIWSADLYNILYSIRKTFLSFLIKTFSIHIRKRLDYIWVKGAKQFSSERLELYGSDHLPLKAEVTFV